MDCRFCGAELYFDKVVIPTGEAEIIINNRYAGLELYIPRNWEIKNMITNFCAAVDGMTDAEGEAVATVTLREQLTIFCRKQKNEIIPFFRIVERIEK